MDVRMEKMDANKLKLEITVPLGEFKKAIDRAYRKNISRFNIPGFRKGKAPRAIIEKMYGEEVFYDDAVNFAIEDTYPKAVDENNLEVVDRPEVDILDIGRDKDLVYTAVVTVKPEVELGEYKGVEVEKVEFPVADEDVEKELQQMREKNARIITREDGEIQKGDTAVIDFEGFIDDTPFEGGKAEDYQLEIGSGSFIEGFEDQLVGKKTGDEADIDVTFPEGYNASELAGKPAVFKVKIKEVKYKELLPLDDEFAKDVSEFESLEELKSDLGKKLQESNDLRATRQAEESVLNKVTENAVIEIPDVMVDREVDYMLEDINYRLRYQGVTLEQYAQMTNTTIEKMREEYRDMAYNKVKTQLVLEKIGKIEGIAATDEEVGQEIEKIAKQYKQDANKFMETIGDREKNIIEGDIVSRKTVEFLVQNAIFTA